MIFLDNSKNTQFEKKTTLQDILFLIQDGAAKKKSGWQPIRGTQKLLLKPIYLRYLNCGDTRTDEVEDAARFEVWKGTLGILGIPYMDVLRVLATILLLGNIEFVEGEGLEVI